MRQHTRAKRPAPHGAWARAAAVALALALLACGRGEPAPVTMRDSAGVAIVENRAPAWPGGAGWRVGRVALRIGAAEGEAAYQLSQVAGATRLDDGTVAVADGGSREVRFYDAEGRFLRAVGGPGGGPGEFTALTALGRAPDGGVWAYDLPLRRVTWMDASGRVTRLTTLGSEPPLLNAVGALSDGTFVLRQLWGAAAVAGARRTGLRRDPVAYVRFDSAGALLDTIGLLAGRQVYIGIEDGRGTMSAPPFAHNSVGAARGSTLVVGSQDAVAAPAGAATRYAFQLEELAADGRLLRLMRVPAGDLAVRAEDVRAWIERRAAEVPPDRAPALREALTSMPAPATRPAHDAVLADPAGDLWVGVPRRDGGPPARWTVLDPAGRWLGDVAVPPGFAPLDVGRDWILGVRQDSLGVESVVVRVLERGKAG